MMKSVFFSITLFAIMIWMVSCQNGYIEHVGSTRLVILQPIPIADNCFDENFKATLELLYPHECHDTVFIQDQVFLERIDLEKPFRKEFAIPQSLVRDFFGSNNPDKRRALREELFYFSDTSFEQNPDTAFLTISPAPMNKYSKRIGDYLSRNRKNSLVYLVSNDTQCRNYMAGSTERQVFSDFAKLNCRIVNDLRARPVPELVNLSVILILLPPEIPDTSTMEQDTIYTLKKSDVPVSTSPVSAYATPARQTRPVKGKPAGNQPCPADSVVDQLNRQYGGIITEFRNLLHYIATTREDGDLKRKFREDAYAEIHKIPRVSIEGIPGNDLRWFLNSGFGKGVVVTPVLDRCRVISGVTLLVR